MNSAYRRGELLHACRKYSLAEIEFVRAIGQDPQDAMAHAMLARTIFMQERHGDAIEEARKAIELDPEEPYGYFILSCVQKHLEKLEDAQSSINLAIELEPGSVMYLRHSAQIAAQLRDWQKALHLSERGLAEAPGDAECLISRAQALRALNRENEAEETLMYALSVEPNNPNVHHERAWQLIMGNGIFPREMRVKAIAHLKESFSIDPDPNYFDILILEMLEAKIFPYRALVDAGDSVKDEVEASRLVRGGRSVFLVLLQCSMLVIFLVRAFYYLLRYRAVG